MFLDAVGSTQSTRRIDELMAAGFRFHHERSVPAWQKLCVLREYGSQWSRRDLLDAAEDSLVVTWDHRHELNDVLDAILSGEEFLQPSDRVLA